MCFELWHILAITQNTVVFVWLGAAHELMWVKLYPQACSAEQQILMVLTKTRPAGRPATNVHCYWRKAITLYKIELAGRLLGNEACNILQEAQLMLTTGSTLLR